MFKLKSKLRYIVNSIQQSLRVNVLSEHEDAGQLNGVSNFKFFKGSALTIPFYLGRTIRGVAFESPELDPLSLCLAKQNIHKFDENLFATDFSEICLKENNKLVKDFINTLSNQDISNFPSWAIAFPWEDNGFSDLKDNYLHLLTENRKHHLESSVSGEDLSILDDEFALSHGVQFKNLISKILEEGFDLTYPRPRVYILKNQRNWRWVMAGDGNHRAYTMSALNNSALPVVVSKVVDRSKSNKWPNVVNGEYTQKEAKHIFDMVFKGDVRIRGCR